jgi:hypothetical protein
MTKELEELLAQPTISVPEAGALFGMCRNTAYAAAKRGDIETLDFGRLKRVPTAWLREKLGL